VAAIEEERDPQGRVSDLVEELGQVLGTVAPRAREAVVPMVEAAPLLPVSMGEERTYRIDIQLDSTCFMKSARALVITSSLEMLGSVLAITPSLEELEWESAGENFSVVLLTDVGPEAIHTLLGDLSEIAGARVEEQVENTRALPAEPAPLRQGELAQLARDLARGRQALWIEVGFVPSASQRSVRASMAIAALGEFGSVVRVEPELAELEHGAAEGFRVLFLTADDPATLRESLLPIAEILTVAITPVSDAVLAEAGTQAPSSPNRSVRPDARARRARNVRVDTERLDGLMDLIGALNIGHGRLSRALERTGAADRPDVRDALDEVMSMAQRLRETLVSLRLVPIETVFGRFPRVARDLSHELGKQVALTIEGHDVALDRLLVDELGELLVHLIRNALDHGLETPAERQKAGKPSTGTLALSAKLEGAQVLVRVADDGRGLDLSRIVAKAVASGRLTPQEAERLPADRALELIFAPGVSTTDRATRLSGRGVGLDAVKSRVDALGGFVHVESTPGQGTSFELRFPIPRDFLARTAEPSARG
jgi:two-component system chemotaxis sensor kinase CheA